MYLPTLLITNLLLQTGLILFVSGSFPFVLIHALEYFFRVYFIGLFLPIVLFIKNQLNFTNNNLINFMSWYIILLSGHNNIFDQHFEREYGLYPSNLLILFLIFIVTLRKFISLQIFNNNEELIKDNVEDSADVEDSEEDTADVEDSIEDLENVEDDEENTADVEDSVEDLENVEENTADVEDSVEDLENVVKDNENTRYKHFLTDTEEKIFFEE